jgi:hypothetical protein
VGCTAFQFSAGNRRSEPENKFFFVRAFRAPRQLQRYHYYRTDGMRPSSDTLPIAII